MVRLYPKGSDPTGIREVHTVGQIGVHRIETVAITEHACITQLLVKLICDHIAFLFYYIKRL